MPDLDVLCNAFGFISGFLAPNTDLQVLLLFPGLHQQAGSAVQASVPVVTQKDKLGQIAAVILMIPAAREIRAPAAAAGRIAGARTSPNESQATASRGTLPQGRAATPQAPGSPISLLALEPLFALQLSFNFR